MNRYADSLGREIHEFYIAKINNLIAEGRESLISSLVADYVRASRNESEPIDKAA